jgi:ABC-type dipeptide/oligopeptide/nickel transport system ATPase component
LSLSDRQMRDLRGDRLAMIFQEPMTSLNPVYSIGEQIAESLIRHRGLSRYDARARTIELLQMVKIPSPQERVDEYPHRLSGGMRQRAMIALALACDPTLLIADEPTTALDVTVQKQILRLIRSLQEQHGTGVIFVTHNIGVVAQICDRATLLYMGRVMEEGTTATLLETPRHPYTRALIAACPRYDRPGQDLEPIPADVLATCRAEIASFDRAEAAHG